MGKTQQELEAEMIDLGKQRYRHKVKRAKETKMETTTPVGRNLLRGAVENLEQGIETWLSVNRHKPGRRHRAAPFIEMLPAGVVSAITCRSLLDSISMEKKITPTAAAIARLLEDELIFRAVAEQEPALWKQMHRVIDRHKSQKTKSKFINQTLKYHEMGISRWDKKDAVAVGLTLIELMQMYTGIIEINTRKDNRGKSYTYLRATDDIMEWMRKGHEEAEVLFPVWLPSVDRPVDWANPFIGGYAAINIRHRPLVKTQDAAYLEELGVTPMDDVYKAVNTLQRVPVRYHGTVAAAVQWAWDKALPVGGLPSMEDHEIPNKPLDIDTNSEARKRWRKDAARVHFENERQKSKRLQVMKTMQVMNRFKDDRVYFPGNLDFRGRWYYIPHYWQPQGPPWTKATLRFDNGAKITDAGARWLWINAANKWGMDKESFNARHNWTDDNIEMIKAIGKEPTSNLEWTKADDPFGFVAACHEISELHLQGSTFRTTLPISLDATTQGLQIYSMLLRDPVSALSTNVLPHHEPSDTYQLVADRVIQKLQESSDPYAKKWLEFGITRSCTKRQTMTLCYGSTFYSCQSYTAEWFYKELQGGKENPFVDETYAPCNFLAGLIWEAINEVVGAAHTCMEWLRECAKVMLEHDVTPRWMTPNGFPVKMRYENFDKQTVKTIVAGNVRRHRINVENGTTSKRKTVNGICANLVHSFDGIGGIFGLTLLKCLDKGVNNVFGVHDAASVLATDCDLFNQAVREATVEIFSEDWLGKIEEMFLTLLPSGVHLPPAPQRGDLDITKVLESPYYWN